MEVNIYLALQELCSLSLIYFNVILSLCSLTTTSPDPRGRCMMAEKSYSPRGQDGFESQEDHS